MMKIKYVIIVLIGLFSLQFGAQNFTISTLRMGDYHLKMTQEEFKELSNTKTLDDDVDYDNPPVFDYHGETIQIYYYYFNDDDEEYFSIDVIRTKSPKFKTKSGMGVGNSNYDLLETYKDYPNFEVSQFWDEEKEDWSKTKKRFTLFDYDAGTTLTFILDHNIVIEVKLAMFYGDC